MSDEVTKKIESFAPRCRRKDAFDSVETHLVRALDGAQAVGCDISDAILKLIASVRRRGMDKAA